VSTPTNKTLLLRESFPFMGDTAVIEASSLDAFSYARQRLWDLEQAWDSAARSSDISRLNDAESSRVSIQRETAALLSYAREAHGRTGGLYDPTMRSSLCETELECAAGSGGVTGLILEEIGDIWWAELPTGTTVDLGGISKGLAADIAAEEIARRYPSPAGVAVSIGGDVRAIGMTRSVSIMHPLSGSLIETTERHNGAVATLNAFGNAPCVPVTPSPGLVPGPQTSSSPQHDVLQVSVAASTCVWAEAVALACLAVGSLEVASTFGFGALAVLRDGTTLQNTHWSGSL
jgi:thiamine biosynthesis lipoprotein